MSRLLLLFGRLLALLLLFGVVGAAYLLIAEPLRQRHAELDQSIALSEQLLDRFARETGDGATLQRQLEALNRPRAVSSGLLRGDNETLGGAFVQSFLTTTVERGGGTVRSVQVLPVREALGLRKVAARLQLHTTATGLRDILHLIEGSDPYLFVDNLDVRRVRQPRPGEDETEEVELLVRFEVYGFLAAKPVPEERS
jgi:general secretion pathway protein M